MPYRGKTSAGLDILQGFLAGQGNKRQNKQQVFDEQQRAIQNEITKAYLKVAQDREAREAGRAKAVESRQEAAFKADMTTFEQGQTDRTRERAATGELNRAQADSSVGQAYQMIRANPRLAPIAKFHGEAFSNLKDDAARAAYAQGAIQDLRQRAMDFAEQDFDSMLIDLRAQGGFNGRSGEEDSKTVGVVDKVVAEGGKLWRNSGGKAGLSPQQRTKLVLDSIDESARNEAVLETRRASAEELRNGPLLKVPAGRREEFRFRINRAERVGSERDFMQIERDMFDAINPDAQQGGPMNEFQRKDTELRERNLKLREDKAKGEQPQEKVAPDKDSGMTNPESAVKSAERGKVIGKGKPQSKPAAAPAGDLQQRATQRAIELKNQGLSPEEVRAKLVEEFAGGG